MTVGTFEAIAQFVGEALAPVKDRRTAAQIDDFLAELGLRLPDGLSGQGGIPNALNAGATDAGELAVDEQVAGGRCGIFGSIAESPCTTVRPHTTVRVERGFCDFGGSGTS